MFFPLHDQNNPPVAIVPWLGYALVAVNVAVYLGEQVLELAGVRELLTFINTYGLVPHAWLAGSSSFTIAGVPRETVTLDFGPHGPWWTLVTYMFLHAGFLHIFGNLWFFWIFADNVEERLGRLPFLALYLGTGIAGGLLHALVASDSTLPLIGASGAVSGVLGAYVVLYPRHRITSYFCPIWFYIRRWDVPAWIVLGFYILLQLLAMRSAALAESPVAFACHVGGFLAGCLAALPFRDPAGAAAPAAEPSAPARLPA